MSVIQPKDGTGVTSCLSVRLSDACAFRRENGYWPSGIDSSKQFWWYDANGNDFFRERINELPPNYIKSPFHHEWQWNWLDDIDWLTTKMLAGIYCSPAFEIRSHAAHLSDLVHKRCYVLYRGNDKAKEIAPTPYEAMIEMAKDSGFDKFFLQTDDQDFYEYWLKHYPDTTTSNLPRIRSNHDQYVMPTDKLQFAKTFNAVLLMSKSASGLITTTGNTGLWAALYRNDLENTWQYNGRHGLWRRIG